MLVAVGVYKNRKIDPKYKYVRANDLNVPLKLDENYLGFHIKASIDNGAKEITIQVNEGIYRMKYHFSVGNMVIIDGATGSIKFFQAKGYSVRGEDSGNILRGIRKISKECAEGKIAPEDITEDMFNGFLDTHDIPDPDLLIRTSGELRLSNYLLWQLAYTEFYFTDVLWPNFNKEKLKKAIAKYNERDRRFGKVEEN